MTIPSGHRAGRLIAATAAAVAGALVLGALVVREVVAPAEARTTQGSSQATPSFAAPAAAIVHLEALGTARDGMTGRPRIEQIYEQKVGITTTTFLVAGSATEPTLCTRVGLSPQPSDDFLVTWRFDVQVVAISGGRTTLEVHWTRLRRNAPSPERDDVRTIVLAPGETHVLDYVENPTEARSCASLMARVSAEPVPDLTTPIAVDFWVVDETDGVASPVAHAHVDDFAGRLFKYELPSIDVAVPESGRFVKVGVGGRIHAAVSPDGFVLVDLETTRRASSGGGETGGRGQVQFRSKLGETVAVMLPEPGGHLSLTPGGRDVIDLAQAFAGHRLSLYLKVQRRQ